MFSENLIKIRKENKMTQKELSKILGVSQPALVKWEKGTSEPNIETIIKIANTYNVSCDYLLKGYDDLDKRIERAKAEAIEDFRLRIINDTLTESKIS